MVDVLLDADWEAGYSSDSINGINSFLMPVTKGVVTLLIKDTRPSRTGLRPSPRGSLSVPSSSWSNASNSSSANLAIPRAWLWFALGVGAWAVGAEGMRKAGDASNGTRTDERLVSKTDSGRWRVRRTAR
jgi:hypothetical protein